MKGELENIKIFQDSEQTYNFLINLLRKHLTEDTLSNCDNPDDLIQLAEILLNEKKQNESFTEYFSKVMERITSLNQSDNSKKFLEYIISKSKCFKLNFSLVEKIYSNQKNIFIEKPIADCFLTYCSNQTKLENFSNLDFLLENVSKSPTLFYIVSNQMKEIFYTTKYSKVSQNFIQKILKKIRSNCDKDNKDILNLYPPSLQHCVILLRINIRDHTEKLKNYTISSLRDIFLKDWTGTLILISQHPDWLPVYLKFFEIINEPSQKSVETVETITVEDD